MGDSWVPSRDRDRGGRESRYPPPRDDYRAYPPPPPPGRDSIRYQDDRYDGRRCDDDRYADSYRRDDYRRDDHRDNSYSFRGAAAGSGGGSGRHDTYRPPQSDFTFDARGPRFPEQQAPPREQPLRPRDKNRQGGPDRSRRNQQGGRPNQQGGRPPYRRFIPKPAHNRAILKFTEGDMEPEQMLGMNGDGPAKFIDIESSDDEDDRASDAASVGQGPGSSRKRVKTDEAAAAAEAERPKWSNPDPYSVLPPTDLGIGPKKDIVQSIRKAKVEVAAQAAGTNAIKDNDDFISFDFGENKAEDDDSSEGDDDDFMGRPPPPPAEDIPPPPPLDDAVMPTDAELMDSYVDGGRKRKRTFEPDALPAAGDIVDEWLSDGSNPTPWVSSDSGFRCNVGLNLHREILDFYDYVAPRDYEKTCRLDIIDRVQRAIRTSPDARSIEVRAFGSFASGLYLPTADMDLVAVSPAYMRGGKPQYCQSTGQKHKLAAKLRAGRIAKDNNVVVVAKAKVPILKFVDDKTGIKVDISFENDSGIRAIPIFETWSAQFPQMPKLVVIIKQFLAMRGMNEVFSGGIGGFTIICLVTSMLQLMPDTQKGSAELSLGELLLHFLDLYGNKFDLAHTGIEMRPQGYFDKDRYVGPAKINSRTLTIIDPNRADNDISGGSRHVKIVFDYFRGAHAAIQRRLNDLRTGRSNSDSILGCILGGNYSTFEAQRNVLSNAVGVSMQPSHFSNGFGFSFGYMPNDSTMRPTEQCNYYDQSQLTLNQRSYPPPPTQHNYQPPPPPQSYYNAFAPPPPGVSGQQHQPAHPHPSAQYAAAIPPPPGGPSSKKLTANDQQEAQRKAAKKAAKKAKRVEKVAAAAQGQPVSPAATKKQQEGEKQSNDFSTQAELEGFSLSKTKKKALASARAAGNEAEVQRLWRSAKRHAKKALAEAQQPVPQQTEPKPKKKKQKNQESTAVSQPSKKQKRKLAAATATAKTERQNSSRDQRALKRAASAEASG